VDTVASWVMGVVGSTEFTTLLLTTFMGVVTAVVGWVAVQFRKRILHDLSAGDLALLRSCAVIAVQYVEQKFRGSASEVKLQEAIKAADTMIASYGLDVTIEQLTKIIEAAVYAEITKTRLPD
jgi:hypothetical protein